MEKEHLTKRLVRPTAICIIRNQDKILVSKWTDDHGKPCCKPLGGGIEHGELATEALDREFKEEIGRKVKNLKYLGVIENIFEWEKDIGHEVVIVYLGEFVDKKDYDKGEFQRLDHKDKKAHWEPLSLFESGKVNLYPTGVFELIK